MQKVTASELSKKLNFFPLTAWPPALPIYCWRKYQISGFAVHDERTTVDLSVVAQGDLLEALLACYPQLSFPEVARLHACLAELPANHLPDDWCQLLWRHHGWNWHTNLAKTIELLVATPREFQDWVGEKGLAVGDLAILRTLDSREVEALTPLCRWLAQSKLSKSEGSQLLELAVELWKMGRLDLAAQFDKAPELPASAILAQLQALRFPTTLKQEAEKKGKLLAVPWPAQIHTRWQRQGDLSSVEIKFNVTSLADLRKKLDGLEYTYGQLARTKEELWTN